MEEELDDMFFINMLNDEEEMEEDEANNGEMRNYPKVDPFTNLNETKFIKCFRLDAGSVRYVIDLVTPHLDEASRKSAVGIQDKVLAALRFFATGSYQEIIGSNLFIGLSQSSISRAINEVCNILTREDILQAHISFPGDINALRMLRQRFANKYQFPGAIGVIDCTHISIVAPYGDPNHPEHIYVNRKGYHSINVQLICDENLKIMNVDSRYPGSTHDAFIWRQSTISQTLEQIHRQYRNESYFFLADSGYPLRRWLLTPVRNAVAGTAEDRFNTRFRCIRSSIERCIGVLKHRFRCLLKHRTLHYKPEIAAKIILSCVVLHNICIQRNVPEPVEDYPPPEQLGLDLDEDVAAPDNNRDLYDGERLRNTIINNLFA